MRGTIHVVAARDYWPLRLATIDLLRRWYRRRTGVPTERTVRLAADRVRTALERDGRLTRKQLDEIAGEAALLGVGLWVGLLRVPPSGTWVRRRADLFADAEAWLGDPPG